MKPVRLAAAAATGLLALTTGMGAAVADAPAQQGWWTTSPAGAATAPDVPADGLLVEGGPAANSPTSFAALTFALPTGATTGKLTLKIAPNSGTVPNATVQVCRLTSPLQPAQGGAMANAPKFDCAGAVTATLATDHITLSTSSLLGSDGQLAIAVLPGAATDRLVFAKPDTSALDVTAPPPPPSAGEVSSAPPAPSDTTAAAPSTFTPSETPLVLPPAEAPTPSPPAPTVPATTTVALAATPAQPAPSSSGSSSASVLAVLALLLAVVTAACLWFGAGAAAARSVSP